MKRKIVRSERVPGALIFWGIIGFCVGAIFGHLITIILFTMLGLAYGDTCRNFIGKKK